MDREWGASTMDIWDWLDPWWAWWVGFTDLFDWDAIAAIATAVAVWVALDQAGRAARVQSSHGAGVFTTLVGLIEPVVELAGVDRSASVHPSDARYILDLGVLDQALAGLQSLPLQDTAPLGISDYIGGLPVALEALKRELPAVAEGHKAGRSVDSHLWYLREAVHDFRQRRSLLLAGPVRKWFEGVWADLQRRWFFRR